MNPGGAIYLFRQAGTKWVPRCPRELIEVLLSLTSLLYRLVAFRDHLRAAVACRSGKEVPRALAEEIVSFRDQVAECSAKVYPLIERYGAEAHGVVRYRGHAATSTHALVVQLASRDVFQLLRAAGTIDDEKFNPDDFEDLVTAGILQENFAVNDIVASLNEDRVRAVMGYSSVVRRKAVSGFLLRLQQEVFRVWKDFYREGKHATFASDKEHCQAFRQLFGLPPLSPRRVAYERDHLWLRWKDGERFTPAKIRDRWDAMTDAERMEICPKCWERVGDGDKSAGREVVKGGLKRAKKEQKQEQG